MTVVVAHIGDGCAVMASDSEASESGHTRYDVEKIEEIGPLLCGYSGSGSVRDRIMRAVTQVHMEHYSGADVIDPVEFGERLQAQTAVALRSAYANFVPSNPAEHFGLLAGALLVLGRAASGYWLLEIDANNTCSSYTDAGFHTIGSGSSAAYTAFALMRAYNPPTLDIASLRLLAYRTVQTCIQTIGGALGVGGSVHLWSATDGQRAVRVVGEEYDAVANGVEQWVTIERESLAAVITAGQGVAPEHEGATFPMRLG